MMPDPYHLIEKTGINKPIIAFYDAPDPGLFEPTVRPAEKGHACMYSFYKRWLDGSTVVLTRKNYGCGGASHHLFSQPIRSHDEYIDFLTDDEGLKESKELMDRWTQATGSYEPEYDYIMYGPLRKDQYDYAKTITFLVNPDQLSMLMIGAQYFTEPGDPEPVIAPFGSGCMQSITLFKDLDRPQALIGATDLAMRQYLPPDILAFTMTKPMFANLCRLDEKSFLAKGFLARLKSARGL